MGPLEAVVLLYEDGANLFCPTVMVSRKGGSDLVGCRVVLFPFSRGSSRRRSPDRSVGKWK